MLTGHQCFIGAPHRQCSWILLFERSIPGVLARGPRKIFRTSSTSQKLLDNHIFPLNRSMPRRPKSCPFTCGVPSCLKSFAYYDTLRVHLKQTPESEHQALWSVTSKIDYGIYGQNFIFSRDLIRHDTHSHEGMGSIMALKKACSKRR